MDCGGAVVFDFEGVKGFLNVREKGSGVGPECFLNDMSSFRCLNHLLSHERSRNTFPRRRAWCGVGSRGDYAYFIRNSHRSWEKFQCSFTSPYFPTEWLSVGPNLIPPHTLVF